MRRALLVRRVPRGAALALLAVVVSGCGSQADYPPNLAFPSRTDRLVLKSPEVPPLGLGEPGQREAELAHLDSVGGKTVDPTSVSPEARAAIDQFLKDSFGTPAASKISLRGRFRSECRDGSARAHRRAPYRRREVVSTPLRAVPQHYRRRPRSGRERDAVSARLPPRGLQVRLDGGRRKTAARRHPANARGGAKGYRDAVVCACSRKPNGTYSRDT